MSRSPLIHTRGLGKVYAPGIGDDTRNIEALLAGIRALVDVPGAEYDGWGAGV